MYRIVVRGVVFAIFLYIGVVLGFCIKEKYLVKSISADEKEVEVSGNFFNAYHDIVALIEKNPQIEKILYVVSPADSIVDKQEMFCDDDYVEYLVKSNLPFLEWQDWKFLMKNNAIAAIKGVVSYPFCLGNAGYIKSDKYKTATTSPEYLYSIINHCNERGVTINPVFLPNPKNCNKQDVEECLDLLQHYVGGVLDYRKQYIADKYMDEKGMLTDEGINVIMKAIKDNIHGVHSQEYVELNKVERVPDDSPLTSLLKSSRKVVFVGNSITEGCNNGGYGWYESMMAAFPDIEVVKIAKGGATSSHMAKWSEIIAKENADLYIVSAGCNDIKAGDPKAGAVSYIPNLQSIADHVLQVSKTARFVFVAPWQRFPETEVENIGRIEYTKVLYQWCKKNNFIFVEPNCYIAERISKAKYRGYYMVDRTHPNSNNGMKLYSEAVLNSVVN